MKLDLIPFLEAIKKEILYEDCSYRRFRTYRDKARKNLRQRRHEVLAASPFLDVNTISGEGLAESLKPLYFGLELNDQTSQKMRR